MAADTTGKKRVEIVNYAVTAVIAVSGVTGTNLVVSDNAIFERRACSGVTVYSGSHRIAAVAAIAAWPTRQIRVWWVGIKSCSASTARATDCNTVFNNGV
jgi:hypothetical protein